MKYKKVWTMLTAVYPGTFDPITFGHRDIIVRAVRKLSVRLIVAVATSPLKSPLFSYHERVQMIEADIVELGLEKQVDVYPFSGLLTDFVHENDAQLVVRGLRAVSDFEYEFQMATANHTLDSNIETVFLMASEGHHFTASSVVREIASHGGDVTPFSSATVAHSLKQKFNQK